MQKLDVYALKSYAFTLHNTNSYFTFGTIFLSIGVVIASVAMNIGIISHIWLSREDLPIAISRSFAYPDPLSSTLLCYSSNTSGPNAKILDQNLQTLTFPFVSQA
jgi:hypothetical protein